MYQFSEPILGQCIQIKNNKEIIMLDLIQNRVLCGAYRISEKTINSITLIILSILLNICFVILILPQTHFSSGGSGSDTDVFVSLHTNLRSKVYLWFADNQKYRTHHYICVGFFAIIELLFQFLVLKAQAKEIEKNIIKLLYFFKMTFRYPIIAISASIFKSSQSKQQIAAQLLISIFLIIFCLTTYLYDNINFSCLYKKLGKSNKSHDWLLPQINFILKLILLYSTIRNKQMTKTQIIILQIGILILHIGWVVRMLIIKIHWYDELLQIVDYFGFLFVTAYFFITLLQIIVPLVHDNRWLVFFSLFVWSSLAFYNFLEHSKVVLLISPIQIIKSQVQAVTYIRLLFSVYEKKIRSSSSILLLGLVKSHINECVNAECICKAQLKATSSSLIKDGQFFLNFISMNIKLLKQKFDGYDMALSYLAFQIQVMSKFPKYFYESDVFRKQNQRKRMSITQKFCLFQIFQVAVTQVTKKRNDEQILTDKNKELMNLEQKTKECYIKIQKILINFSCLYKYNSRSFCGLNLLKTQLEEIYRVMMEIYQLVDGKQKMEDCYSEELIFLMFFFYHNVFSLNFMAKPLLTSLQKLYKKLQLKQISQDNFDLSLYGDNGCVIQSTLQSNVFGLVTRVSANTLQIFKYPTIDSMINLDVNHLLPRCSREQHQRMILQWLSTGSFKKINKLQQTFCLNYQETLMKVLMRSQIAVIEGKVSIFVGIIKLDSEDCMIVDRFNKIDSYGTDFSRILIKESRSKDITDFFPNFTAISQELKRQPNTIKTIKMGIHIRRRNSKSRRSGVIMAQQRAEDEEIEQKTNLTVQTYVGWMRNCDYIVIRKIGDNSPDIKATFSRSTYSQQQDNLPSVDQNLGMDPKSINFIKEDKQRLVEVSSVSSGNNDLHFTIWRMLEEVKRKATSGDQLQNPMLNYVTIALAILYKLILITMVCLFIVQIKGSASFNQVIYADSAVSDNMQLLQICHNNIIVFGEFCGPAKYDFEQCQSLTLLASDISNILKELLARDIQDLVKNVTFFGNPYFLYELTEVNMVFNGSQIKVGTFQFMEYYIRSTKYVLNSLQTQNTTGQQYDLTVKLLKDNWPQLKRLNHYNIYFYEAIGISELQKYTSYIIIFSFLYGILVAFYTTIQFKVSQSSQNFLNRILTFYRRVPTKTSEKLAQYYKEASNQIKMKDITYLSKISMPYINDGQSLTLQGYRMFKDYSQIIYLGIFLIFTLMFLSISTYKAIEYSNLQKNTILTLNQLLQSENYMLEGYFSLTSTYMHGNPQQSQLIALEKLLFNSLGIVQNNFVKTALDISHLASLQDINLANQFSQLLFKDICEASKNLTSSKQQYICQERMGYQFLKQGIITAMTFFQNTIVDTAMDLRLNHTDINANYFKKQQFKDLNKYMLYFLRLYQGTQEKMMFILNYIKDQRLQAVNLIVILQILLQTFLIIKWFCELKKKKIQLSKCYGFILPFPVPVIKQSKFIQQELASLV